MHIEQAELVFKASQIAQNRYHFEEGNIFEHTLTEPFDVVLCLGLMYHVAKPLELFELMVNVGAELIVIDTEIFPGPGSSFKVKHEPIDEPRNAVDYDTVLLPTRQAVMDLASQFGYATVPIATRITDYTGMTDYREGWRLAFICSKSVSLDGLQAQPRYARPARSALGLARVTADLARRRRALRR
jgi:hypothetical protein